MHEPQEYQAMPWMIDEIHPSRTWPTTEPLLPPADLSSGDQFAAFFDAQLELG